MVAFPAEGEGVEESRAVAWVVVAGMGAELVTKKVLEGRLVSAGAAMVKRKRAVAG